MRRRDLAALLLQERQDLGHVAQLLHHLLRFEADARCQRLHDAYAPFDPDPLVPTEAAGDLQDFLGAVDEVLEEANFRRLTQPELQAAFEERSLFPVMADVPLDEYDVLRLYRRGVAPRTERVRGWRTLWRWRTRHLDVFERLVVVLRLRPEAIGQSARTVGMEPGRLYLKSFKNVPTADVEMVLPNTRLRLRPVDRVLTGGPLLAGVGWTVFQSIGILAAVATGAFALTLDDPRLRALGGVLLVLAGYLWRTHTKIKTRRLEYMRTLSQGLYFRNLANNRTVLDQVLRMGQDEEEKEALLAYHFLSMEPMSAQELDARAEAWIHERTGRATDFDVHDGLQRLDELGIASRQGATWQALAPAEAARVLDARWDDAFQAAPT